MISASPTTSPAPGGQSARRTVLLLAAVFILPVVVASGLYGLNWRPEKFGNHGTLLQPPQPLPESGLRQIDGRLLPTAELRGKWLLVLAVRGGCDAICENRLQDMLQAHVALNKERNRVLRVLISSSVPDQRQQAMLGDLPARFPDLVVASVSTRAAAANWSASLPEANGATLYVVDPFAKVMMRYSAPVDMRGVIKDLERLLKYSWNR